MQKISLENKKSTSGGIFVSTIIAVVGGVFGLASLGLSIANGVKKVEQARNIEPPRKRESVNSQYSVHYRVSNK